MKLTTEDTENTERATPETDALILSKSGFGPTDWEWRLHSRRLERERDEALEKYFVMRDLSNNATELAEKYKRERDEARDDAQRKRVELNHLWQANEMAEQAFRERDAWRAMATELADAAAYGLAQWEQGYTLEASRKFTDSLIRFQKMQKDAEQ